MNAIPNAVTTSADFQAREQESAQALSNLIAERAYQIWQAKGCPANTAQQDWAEAENQLKLPRVIAAAAGE